MTADVPSRDALDAQKVEPSSAPPSTAHLPSPVSSGEPGTGSNDASLYQGQAGYGGLKPKQDGPGAPVATRDPDADLRGERGALSSYGFTDSMPASAKADTADGSSGAGHEKPSTD